MYKRRPPLVDLLKVDDERAGVMFGVRKNLGAKQSDDMIRDHFSGFVLKVCIVDAEIRIEPVDFTRDEFTRDETLHTMETCQEDGMRDWGIWTRPWQRPRAQHVRVVLPFRQIRE